MPNQLTQFQVIEAYNLAQFTLLVQTALAHGWTLQGGVSVQMLVDSLTDEYSYFYAQGVTRIWQQDGQDESTD